MLYRRSSASSKSAKHPVSLSTLPYLIGEIHQRKVLEPVQHNASSVAVARPCCQCPVHYFSHDTQQKEKPEPWWAWSVGSSISTTATLSHSSQSQLDSLCVCDCQGTPHGPQAPVSVRLVREAIKCRSAILFTDGTAVNWSCQMKLQTRITSRWTCQSHQWVWPGSVPLPVRKHPLQVSLRRRPCRRALRPFPVPAGPAGAVTPYLGWMIMLHLDLDANVNIEHLLISSNDIEHWTLISSNDIEHWTICRECRNI